MKIPNLPTDNLYKFIALTGVFLFVISIFYPEYELRKIRDEIIQFNGEVILLNYEKENAKLKLEQIESEIKRLDEKMGNNSVSFISDSLIVRTRVIDGPDEIVNLSNRIDILLNEWTDLNQELDRKKIEIGTKSELIDSKTEDLSEINEVIPDFVGISFAIALLGFIFWYNLTQRHQDKLLKEQAFQYIKTSNCQSCGMKLSNQTEYYKLSEEEKKFNYCHSCYSNGRFTEPDLTVKEMKEKVKNRCKELGIGRFRTAIIVGKIASLERWRSKFSWE